MHTYISKGSACDCTIRICPLVRSIATSWMSSKGDVKRMHDSFRIKSSSSLLIMCHRALNKRTWKKRWKSSSLQLWWSNPVLMLTPLYLVMYSVGLKILFTCVEICKWIRERTLVLLLVFLVRRSVFSTWPFLKICRKSSVRYLTEWQSRQRLIKILAALGLYYYTIDFDHRISWSFHNR